MRWKDWLENWSMTSLKINAHFLEMEWQPQDADKNAAWELYIELLTRITTQPQPPDHSVEKAAFDSVFSLFALTRDIIKRHGRGCAEFTKLAIVVLNQIVRPFTALQTQLTRYTPMLGAMAGVEGRTKLEAIS